MTDQELEALMIAEAEEAEEDEDMYQYCFGGYEYSAEDELDQLCCMVQKRYPEAPDYEEIDQVSPEQIGKKILRVAVCAEMPGVVTYFLIAGFRKGTDSDIVFCVSGMP